MKITIGLNCGDRVQYKHRKDLVGTILEMKGEASLVEWDYARYPILKQMWVGTRALRRVGIIRSLVSGYQRKAKEMLEIAKIYLP